MTDVVLEDLQAKAASELDVIGIRSCEFFDARELIGLSRMRCRVCKPCIAFEKFLSHVDFLRWAKHRGVVGGEADGGPR